MPVEQPSFASYLRHLRKHGHEAQKDGPLNRAVLANETGIAFSYVTKLEQGAAQHPSAEVIDHLADVLGADDVERQHLHDLVVYDREVGMASVAPHVAVEVTDQMRGLYRQPRPSSPGIRVDDAWNVLYANPDTAGYTGAWPPVLSATCSCGSSRCPKLGQS